MGWMWFLLYFRWKLLKSWCNLWIWSRGEMDMLKGVGTWIGEDRNHSFKAVPSAVEVQGVDTHDCKGIANAINSFFANVNADIPEINIQSLPSYLPSPTPPITVQPWEVYKLLSRLKSGKASGPAWWATSPDTSRVCHGTCWTTLYNFEYFVSIRSSPYPVEKSGYCPHS